MRLNVALQILLANTITNHAFHTTIPIAANLKNREKISAHSSALFAGSVLKNPEWDNDDFLSSLSGTPEEREEVNRQYYGQAEETRLSQERMASWRQRQEATNPFIQEQYEEGDMGFDEGQEQQSPPEMMGGMLQPGDISGGSRFRKMMEMSRQSNGPALKPPQVYQQQQPQSSDPNKMFKQQQYELQPYQPQQSPTKDENRPVDRNKYANQIANASDEYFAQLKVDSKARKRAFLSGDYDTSNKVFEDDPVAYPPQEYQQGHLLPVPPEYQVQALEQVQYQQEQPPPLPPQPEITTPPQQNAEAYSSDPYEMLNQIANEPAQPQPQPRMIKDPNDPSPTKTSAVVAPPIDPIEGPVVDQQQAATAPTIGSNTDDPVLSSSLQTLEEAMQMCQDPSLSNEEKAEILLSAQMALQQAASALDSK